MAKETILEIIDEVNIRFHGLDVLTRRKLADKVKFLLPYARHTPAFRLGRWDGMVRFCDVGGRSYLNLLDRLIPIVQEAGYNINIEDKRLANSFVFDQVNETSYESFKWPEGHVVAGQSITLRDYQVDIINKYLANPQGLQDVSTGAGKTLITAVLSHQVEKYGRSIIIVPSKDLVTQTELDFINMGLDVGVYFGDRKEYGKTHTICTWQSLEALDKKSKRFDENFPIDAFVEDVVCVIVDEAHGTKADVLKKLLTTVFAHVPLRWGMTGTIPEEEFERLSLECCIGPILNRIRAKDLQDKGVLSKLHISMVQINDAHVGFDNYASELKWLTTDVTRIRFLADHINSSSLEGNTLVLVDRIETGEMLMEYITDSVFISGKVKSKDRKSEYDQIQTANNKVIIATYGVASTGIDIPRIFNLYLMEPGKSFIRVIQSIGRGIRKAQDKDFVNVFDISSTCKYSKRHLSKRKKFYAEAEYPYKVVKVQY